MAEAQQPRETGVRAPRHAGLVRRGLQALHGLRLRQLCAGVRRASFVRRHLQPTPRPRRSTLHPDGAGQEVRHGLLRPLQELLLRLEHPHPRHGLPARALPLRPVLGRSAGAAQRGAAPPLVERVVGRLEPRAGPRARQDVLREEPLLRHAHEARVRVHPRGRARRACGSDPQRLASAYWSGAHRGTLRHDPDSTPAERALRAAA